MNEQSFFAIEPNSMDQSMTSRSLMLRLACLVFLGLAAPLQAQVDYHGNDSPWGQRAESGPDAKVPGWFYNLGITGLRAQLVADQPKALLIKYVFPKSPAAGPTWVEPKPRASPISSVPTPNRPIANERYLIRK